jgi:predicted alpha/beta superfamily hydrolase
MFGVCSFVVEISPSIYVEQKRLIEKAEEEERLRKEKEEKRIKEAEKQAADEKGAPDASPDVDSKETHDHVQEDENKVGISFCFSFMLIIHQTTVCIKYQIIYISNEESVFGFIFIIPLYHLLKQ